MANISNSILALIPQNKEGELVLNQAFYFQKALDLRIFILNVIKGHSFFFQKFRAKENEALKKDAEQKLNIFIENAIQNEVPHHVIARIKTGGVVRTLIRESKKGGYEFIVVDKSEGSYDGTLTRGEIDKFVSRSHCPVMTVNKDFPVSGINKIIIPIDISQSTKKRLLWATLFAKKFEAKILIVSAINVDIDETKSLAFKKAKRIELLLQGKGVDCEVKILKAVKKDRTKAILEYIEVEKPELVIIRTHEEPIFSGTNIGKFVSEIVHGCKMPVFTVNYSKKPHLTVF